MKFTQYHITLSIFIVLISASAIYKFQQENKNTYNYKTISYYQVYSLNKPKTLTFCDEQVPLNNPIVQKKIDKEIYHYNYLRNETHYIIKRVNKWFPRFEKILKKNNLPEDLKYIAVVESNLSNATSHRGAQGYWQFTKPTALSMGLAVNDTLDERDNPMKSTKAACKYFKIAHRHFNNWTNAAASYNIGITGLQRQIDIQQKESYFDLKLNRETGGYIYRALALKEILENKDKYGFSEEEHHYHEPLNTPQKKVELLDVMFFNN